MGILEKQETTIFSSIEKKGKNSTSRDEQKRTNNTFQRKNYETWQDTKMRSWWIKSDLSIFVSGQPYRWERPWQTQKPEKSLLMGKGGQAICPL